MLVVTNSTNETLVDRFGGVEYEFPAGRSVGIPFEVARHIFGYGEGNKEPYLIRLGWLKTIGGLDEAMKKLGGFSFSTDESILTEQRPAPLIGEEAGEDESADSEESNPAESQDGDTVEQIIAKRRGRPPKQPPVDGAVV